MRLSDLKVVATYGLDEWRVPYFPVCYSLLVAICEIDKLLCSCSLSLLTTSILTLALQLAAFHGGPVSTNSRVELTVRYMLRRLLSCLARNEPRD